MKIAFLVDCFPTISETFVLNQITYLIDLGHTVTIFSGCRSKEEYFHEDVLKYDLLSKTYYYNDIPKNKFIRVIDFLWIFFISIFRHPKVILKSLNFFKYGKPALALTLFYKAVLFLNTGPFDILQCHFGPNGSLAATLKEMGIPGKIVTMFHAYDIRRGIDEGGQLYKNLFEKGDILLSISEYNYKNLINLGANPQTIKYLPVGIDLKKFPFKEKNFIENGTIKILTVARLHKIKGLEYGLKAIHTLVHVYHKTNFQYQIVGDGPLKEELMDLAKELKISDYVEFLGSGKQEEVIRLLKKANLFFLPSLGESTPVSLMEAQAVGLPCVATFVGSVYELVLDNISGFLVERKNSSALGEKLNYLIEHPQEWAKMGQKGRANIERKYDMDQLAKKLENIYKEVL